MTKEISYSYNARFVKKAIRISYSLRLKINESELYPILGEFYMKGYKYTVNGFEDYWILNEPVPEDKIEEIETDKDLEELGYVVYDLKEDGTIERTRKELTKEEAKEILEKRTGKEVHHIEYVIKEGDNFRVGVTFTDGAIGDEII